MQVDDQHRAPLSTITLDRRGVLLGLSGLTASFQRPRLAVAAEDTVDIHEAFDQIRSELKSGGLVEVCGSSLNRPTSHSPATYTP